MNAVSKMNIGEGNYEKKLSYNDSIETI